MEVVIVIGAVLAAVLVFGWLLRAVRTTLKTALFVAFVFLILQLVFGIGPEALVEQVRQWFSDLPTQ